MRTVAVAEFAQRQSAQVVPFRRPRPVGPAQPTPALRRLCEALDVSLISNEATRAPGATAAVSTLNKLLTRHGEEHLTFLLRTIIESEGNARALIEPVIMAVSSVMLAYPQWPATGLAWIEHFDNINLLQLHRQSQPMRPKGVMPRASIAGMLVQRLHPIFHPCKVKPAKTTKPERPPAVAKVVEQGQLLLQHKGPHANSDISKIGESVGLHYNDCSKVMAVARLYGDRQYLVRSLSRDALFTLAMPSMPQGVRALIEDRLAAGERVTSKEMHLMRRLASTN